MSWLSECGRIKQADKDWEVKYAAKLEKQAACKHDGRFTVAGWNSMCTGTCLDCNKELPLDDIFRTYFKKFDEILDKAGVK
jgi:hypothetical protein